MKIFSQPGRINFTALEDLCKWLLMINTQAGQDDQYCLCIPQQKFGEVSTPEHTKGKLIIPRSSVRTTGKWPSSVLPAQPLSPCSGSNGLCYTNTQKSQDVLLVHSVGYLWDPAERQPVADVVERFYTTACLWAAHTEALFQQSLSRCTSSFRPGVPWLGLFIKASTSKWPTSFLTPHTAHGLVSPNN